MGTWATRFVLSFLVACGARGAVSSPSEHRSSWRAVTSEHFIIWTNASPTRSRTLVTTLENLRNIVLGVSFFKQEVRGKSFVIAFNDLDEVHQYVPAQFIAHAWSQQNVLLQPIIVFAASSLDDDRRIVTHELTHVIAFNVISHQPAWFAEGLAGYFETVRLDENRASVDVGVPLEYRLRQIHDNGLTPAARLFACTQPACMDDQFYATTWALVTYLLNEHTTQFMEYMTKLIDTPADQQASLWDATFPDLPPSTLDHELASWVHYGQIKVMHYNIALRDWPLSEQPLAEADALAAKGILRYLQKPDANVPTEITRSLELDATNVLANMISAVTQKSITPDRANAITVAHPDDWRAWWLAWRAAQTETDAREAREKTCSLLDANLVAVPIEACKRDATGAFAEDPRRQIFIAATQQFGPCLKRSKPADLIANMTIDIDISDSGAVSAAHVSIGSPDTNACVETILRALTFPAHHPGPFHVSSARTH